MIYKRLIFVSRLSAIGDVILSLRALKLLKNNNYQVVFITSKPMHSVLNLVPFLKYIICMQKGAQTEFFIENKKVGRKEFFAQLHVQSVIGKPFFLDLQNTTRSKRALQEMKREVEFQKIYKAPKKSFYRLFLILISYLSFSQKPCSEKLNIETIESIQELQEKIVDKIILEDKLRIDPRLHGDGSVISADEDKSVDDTVLLSSSQNYICLFPGASSAIKTWPKENVKELIDLILQHTNLHIVLCGAQSEIATGIYLASSHNHRVINLINHCTLPETFSLIKNAQYIITNDSFAAHAAKEFKRPASVLFGSTSPKFGFAPKAPFICVEYLNLKCSPCTRHGKRDCRFENLKCLKEISAQRVFENMQKNLQTQTIS